MGRLEKARIYDPDNAAAQSFYVQFNPNQITVSESYGGAGNDKGVRAERQDGGAAEPQLQGDPVTPRPEMRFSVTLFYNTWEGPSNFSDVRAQLRRFFYFQSPPGAEKTLVNHRIGFAWGSLTVLGKLSSLRVTYQMFAPSGVPVRAEAALEIEGDDPDRAAAAFEEQASAEIAGDPAEWRQKGGLPADVAALFGG